ncbi:MAG: extracellular solute-binding protein [Pseudomonadota bacterium]
MDWTRRDLGKAGLSAGILAALPWTGARAETADPIISHGVSAFGDLRYPPDFSQFDYAMADAPKGGTFSTGFGGISFDTLNAYVLKGNPVVGMSVTTDTLMTPSSDEADALYGLVANSIEYDAERSYALFELRPEARFHDGSALTAEDVKFSFDVLREKGHPRYRLILQGVEGATVEAPHRIRFTFRDDVARRDLPMAVAGLPIFAKAWFDSRDFSEATLEPLMTSGPYEVEMESLEPGRTVVYRRRPDYWAADLPVNRGRHNFDRIRIEYFRDRSAAFEAFKAGTYTFNEEYWSKLWATGYDFPAVTRGDILRDVIPDNLPSGTQGYWFNLRREKFADPRVREALAICFDFEWSNKSLFYDLYQRTNSFFEGGPMEAADQPGPAELALLEPLADRLPGGVLDDAAYVPPATDGSGRNRRNLRRAAKLLDEAGWSVIGDIRQNAAGETLSVEFLSRSPSFDRITGPYVQLLKRVGVDATMRRVDAAQYERRQEEYDFDIIVDRKAMSLTPGVELRDYFHSASAASPGSENLAGVSSPAVDALLAQIEAAPDRESLTTAVKALDRVLRAMHIWIPQWTKASHHLAFWDIYGRPPIEMKPAYHRGVIDLWWADQNKLARFDAKFAR